MRDVGNTVPAIMREKGLSKNNVYRALSRGSDNLTGEIFYARPASGASGSGVAIRSATHLEWWLQRRNRRLQLYRSDQSCLMRDKRTRKLLRKYRQYDARNWQKDYWARQRKGGSERVLSRQTSRRTEPARRARGICR